MIKKLIKLPIYLIDGLAVSFGLLALYILITGGGLYFIAETCIRMHHIANSIIILYFLLVIRFLFDSSTPFMGISLFHLNRFYTSTHKICITLYNKINNLKLYNAHRIALIIIGLSLIIKVLNAYYYFGFYVGDDVEVHEMTFAHLYHWKWQALDLRSPFFPMIFIYPIQSFLFNLGIKDTSFLIFSGRLVVVFFSALNLLLVFKIATHLFKSVPVGLLSVVFLGFSKLHITFASSELPRTVSSTFVLLCLWFLLDERNYFSIFLAGVTLGIGAAIRFSELIFIATAILYLSIEKRFRHAILLGMVSIVIFLMVIGISDKLYWGKPFFSFWNIVDFTLLKGLSTTGYQPFYYYFLRVGLWSNFFTFGLALFSLKFNSQKIYIWAFVPLIFLSFLPHKEPRYLVPLIPFISIMAALSLWNFLLQIRYNICKFKIPIKVSRFTHFLFFILIGIIFLSHKEPKILVLAFPIFIIIGVLYLWRRFLINRHDSFKYCTVITSKNLAALLIIVLIGIIIFEIDGFRFRRFESGIEIARFLAQNYGGKGVAIEQSWKTGGRLYLWKIPKLENMDLSKIHDKNYFLSKVLKKNIQWVAVRDENVKKYGYDSLLKNYGFKEVFFSKRRYMDSYRLYKKEE